MKKKSLLLFAILTANLLSFGQIFPENGAVFIDTEIPKIYITIDVDSLKEILDPENRDSDHEFPAIFNFKTSLTDLTVENIGFRLRGNTSRSSAKKSFKVSFNTFKEGGKFFGLEKMNINGEHNDPSIIRSKLSYDLFRNAEVPAARSNHVELYINNEFKGLYMNVEHIDEEFAESRFANKNGNLYKCLWPATLEYIDNKPDSYKFIDGRLAYDLKTNTVRNDYSDLAHFIDVINNTPISDLHEKLEPIFNVNSFLKYLVIEALSGHWDAYSYNKNNFYLYNNSKTGKFEFIPFDLDNTFGIDWLGVDWGVQNIYEWVNSWEARPLNKRILQNQVYKDRFSFYMNQALTNYFNETALFPKIDAAKTTINQSAENDNYRSLDYAWSIDDFNKSYTERLETGHVTYGIKPYISSRNTSAVSQLFLNNISPIISRVSNNQLLANHDFEVFAHVEDEDSELEVILFYQLNGTTFLSVSMLDNGLENDKIAGDNIYSALIKQPFLDFGSLEYYINATDNSMQTTREPYFGNLKEIIPEESDIELYINEFLAKNSRTNADEFGEFNDWIEIYNAGNEAVWLGDKYLSDDINERNKWLMPDRTINSGEFLLFWADSDEEQGIMHTNFKLSADGEEIGIFDNTASGFAQIDYVQFGIQTADLSVGLLSDGIGEIQVLSSATPGFSNLLASIPTTKSEANIRIFPNPVSDKLSIEIDNNQKNTIYLSVFNILGKTVFTENFSKSEIQINFNKLNVNSGIYLLKLTVLDNNNKTISSINKRIIYNK